MDTVSRDVAEHEFDRFCEAMDLDADVEPMDEEGRKGLAAAREKFVRAVMRGRLSVDDDGVPTFHGRSGELSIRFPEPRGDVFLAGDKGKSGHDAGKMVLMMAKVTGEAPQTFSRMSVRDFEVCVCIMVLFLG